MKFTNNLEVFNGDEWHTEICRVTVCQSTNNCVNTECYLRSDYNSKTKNDTPMCYECMVKDNIFNKMKCQVCDEIVFDKEKIRYDLSNCKCHAKTIKKIKEKPILECQWVRARDYQ